MTDANDTFKKYDKKFVEAVRSCNLEEVKSLVVSAPNKLDIEIPDQSTSMFAHYQIIYEHLADSKKEAINTSIQVLVYIGQYVDCKTKDFMRAVKDYCNYQVSKVYKNSNGNPDKAELLELQQMLKEADGIINSPN